MFNFKDINVENLLKIWKGFTVAKMLVSTLSFSILFLSWYCRVEIQHVIKNIGTPSVEVIDYSKGLPTSVSKTDRVEISKSMKGFLEKNNDVIGIMMYEFVPPGPELLYQGRVIVAAESSNGVDIVDRYDSEWLPMQSDQKQIAKLMRGDIFFRPPSENEELIDPSDKTKTNMRLMERDGVKFMISVPISDSVYQVRGYVTVLMSKYPSKEDFRGIVNIVQNEALEYSQYLIK